MDSLSSAHSQSHDDDAYGSYQRSHSATTHSYTSDSTWQSSVLGPERLGKGAVLFTGPDGIRDHRVRVEAEHRYVGEGVMSPEGTSDVDYLWRAPQWMPHPRPKSCCVGEIGWGIPTYVDWSAPRTGAQTQLGEFRQQVEDRQTHLYQNAWYPGPNDVISPDSDAALVMNIYKSDNKSYNHGSQGNTGQNTGSRRSSTYSYGSSNGNANNNNSYFSRPHTSTGHRYHSISSYQY